MSLRKRQEKSWKRRWMMLDKALYLALDLAAALCYVAAFVTTLQGQPAYDYLQTGLLFAILGRVYSIRDQHKRCRVEVLFKEDKR